MNKIKALKCFAIIWTDKHSVIVDSIHKTKKEAQKKLDWLIGKNPKQPHRYEIKYTVMGTELGKTYRKAQAYDNLVSGEVEEILKDWYDDQKTEIPQIYKNKTQVENYLEILDSQYLKLKQSFLSQQKEISELKKKVNKYYTIQDKSIRGMATTYEKNRMRELKRELKQLCKGVDRQ